MAKKVSQIVLMIAGILALLWGAIWVFNNRYAVTDWLALLNYTASPAVSDIADDVSLTEASRRMFFRNDPKLLTGAAFRSRCGGKTEKSIVLGCYLSGNRGIYLYEVADERLNGVVEVTAAHEMLHVAYERLSSSERDRVDRLLNNYRNSHLDDKRIVETLQAYGGESKNIINNEMHSIFATEVNDLPPELEAYYRQYFIDRKAVVGLADNYQQEFTSRRAQTDAMDADLAVRKPQIDANQQSLASMYQAILASQAELNRLRSTDNIAAYNSLVGSYNQRVDSYNTLRRTTQSQIDEYNQIVERRNTLALEEKQLVDALSGDISAQ